MSTFLAFLLATPALAGWEPAPLMQANEARYGRVLLVPGQDATLVVPAGTALRLTSPHRPVAEDISGGLALTLPWVEDEEGRLQIVPFRQQRTLRLSSVTPLAVEVEFGADRPPAAAWSRMEDRIGRALLGQLPEGRPLDGARSPRSDAAAAEARAVVEALKADGLSAEEAARLAIAGAVLQLEDQRALGRSDHAAGPWTGPTGIPEVPVLAAPEGGNLLPAGHPWRMMVEGPAVVEWSVRVVVPDQVTVATVQLWGDAVLRERRLLRTVGTNEVDGTPRLDEAGRPVSVSHRMALVVPPGKHEVELRADAEVYTAARVQERRDDPFGHLQALRVPYTQELAMAEVARLRWQDADALLRYSILADQPGVVGDLAVARILELGGTVREPFPETLPTALALLRRWDRLRDITPELLIPYAPMFAEHGDPGSFGRWLDALEPAPLRSRGLAALRPEGPTDLAEALQGIDDWSIWSSALPCTEDLVPFCGWAVALPNLVEKVATGPGPGQPQRTFGAESVVLLSLPPADPGRHPVLRLMPDGPTEFTLDGSRYVVSGPVEEPLAIAVEAGDHSLRVQSGSLRLSDPIPATDGTGAYAGTAVRVLKMMSLPASFQVPGIGWGTELLVTLEGGPGEADLDLGGGDVRHLRLDGGQGSAVVEVSPGTSVVHIRGTEGLLAHVAWRRPTRDAPPGWGAVESSVPFAMPKDPYACLRAQTLSLDGQMPDAPEGCVISRRQEPQLLERARLLQALNLEVSARRDLLRILNNVNTEPSLLAEAWRMMNRGDRPLPSSAVLGPVSPPAVLAAHADPGPITPQKLRELGAPALAAEMEMATEPVVALADALLGGVAGEELIGTALQSVSWIGIPYVASGSGTVPAERSRKAPEASPYLRAREAMLGSPWDPSTYVVVRDDNRSRAQLSGGPVSVEVLCRDELPLPTGPKPCKVTVSEDGVVRTLSARDGQILWFTSSTRLLRVGPADAGHALVVHLSRGNAPLVTRLQVDAWMVGPRSPVRFTLAAPGVVQVWALAGTGSLRATVDGRPVALVPRGDGYLLPVMGNGPASVELSSDSSVAISMAAALPDPVGTLVPPMPAGPPPDPVDPTFYRAPVSQLSTRGEGPTVGAHLAREDVAVGQDPVHDTYVEGGGEIARRVDPLPVYLYGQLNGRLRLGAPSLGAEGRVIWAPDPYQASMGLSFWSQPALDAWMMRGRLSGRTDLILGPSLEVIPEVQLGLSLGRSPLGDGMVDHDAWSSWAAGHPVSWNPSVTARYLPARELRVEAAVEAVTDAAPWNVDHLSGGLTGRWLLPPWLLFSSTLDLVGYLPSVTRSEGWVDPRIALSAGWFPWVDRNNRLLLSAEGRFHPGTGAFESWLSLGWQRNEGRGLRDLPPDTIPFASSLEWHP